MKHFEAYLGDKWTAWQASTTCTISRKAGIVTIVQDFDDDQKKGRLKTVVNLDTVPAYSIFEPKA